MPDGHDRKHQWLRDLRAILMTDFTIKQGTDFRRNLRCKDGDGNLIDFTGYKARFLAVYREVMIEKTETDLFDFTTDGASDAGLIYFHLTVAESRQVQLGAQMLYAFEVWAPGNSPPGSGDQTVILEGYLVGEQGLDNVD